MAATPAVVTGSADVVVRAAIAGLAPSTKYFFRLTTSSSGVVIASGVSALTTASTQLVAIPTVTTPAGVASVGDTTATLGGTVSTFSTAVASVSVEYATSATVFESVVSTVSGTCITYHYVHVRVFLLGWSRTVSAGMWLTLARIDFQAVYQNPITGTVYYTDNSLSVIWQVSPAGVLSVFAGAFNSPGYVDATGGNARFNRSVPVRACCCSCEKVCLSVRCAHANRRPGSFTMDMATGDAYVADVASLVVGPTFTH